MVTVIRDKIRRRVKRISKMIAQGNGNPISLAIKIFRLQISRGFSFVEIHDNELDLRDKEYEESFLNWKEQKKYLYLLNPRKYFSLARNKYLTHVILERLGIQHKAKLLCYYNPEMGLSSDQVSIDLKSTVRILKSIGAHEFVIKTTESSHGDNVWVIKNADFSKSGDIQLTRFDGVELMLSELLTKEPLIFENTIKQTQQMSALNPTSVNTVRFMTVLMPTGEAKTIACFVKIGRTGRCVDNAGGGGNVDAAVDIETGCLYNSIKFNSWRETEKIKFHPDTNAKLDGLIINDWVNIRNTVESFQKKMPFVKAAGWDIALTDNGPVIIEVNDMWDRTGQLFIGRGWRREITQCYEEWLNFYTK